LIALRGLALLLLLQAAGEALTHALKLPFPGPVIGLVLLLAALALRPATGGGNRGFHMDWHGGHGTGHARARDGTRSASTAGRDR